MPANLETKHRILQALHDRLAAVDCPEGFEDVMKREVDRAVGWVETKLRTSLSPVRFTDLPRTPEEAYKNRGVYEKVIEPIFLDFPTWELLTAEQRAVYNNMQPFYRAGSLPWEALTTEQQMIWASNVKYAENKIGPAEKQDGKGTSYIRLYRGRVTQLFEVKVQYPGQPGYQIHNQFGRTYTPGEIVLYEREGALRFFPVTMSRLLQGAGGDSLYGMQYGVVAPRLPKSMVIDYEYGFVDPPDDLIDVVALRAATQIIPQVSALMTGGLGGFGVDGFNVSFNNGMFDGLLKSFEEQIASRLQSYYTPYMTGW